MTAAHSRHRGDVIDRLADRRGNLSPECEDLYSGLRGLPVNLSERNLVMP